MKSIRVLCAISILGLNAVACGDDSSDKNAGGDMATFVTQCKTFCQDQVDLDCAIVDLATCQSLCDAYGASTGDCATKLKALGTCRDAATDVCSASTCAAEQSAVQTACATTS